MFYVNYDECNYNVNNPFRFNYEITSLFNSTFKKFLQNSKTNSYCMNTFNKSLIPLLNMTVFADRDKSSVQVCLMGCLLIRFVDFNFSWWKLLNVFVLIII